MIAGLIFNNFSNECPKHFFHFNCYLAFREELIKQQKMAKKSKKSLGKKLKDYEDDFFADTGR